MLERFIIHSNWKIQEYVGPYVSCKQGKGKSRWHPLCEYEICPARYNAEVASRLRGIYFQEDKKEGIAFFSLQERETVVQECFLGYCGWKLGYCI